MAVDLNDLIPSLKREVSVLGSDEYSAIADDQWLGYLTDAFWEARLTGLLAGYTESDGSVTPSSGSTDIPRELQQLIVLFAGFRLALTTWRNLNSSYRYKAGPVETEVQKSAQTLKALLDALRARMSFIIDNLSVYGVGATSVAQFDQVVERSYEMFGGGYSSWYVSG